MVKKKGKDRQDKYYYLAKETGYRARSAFKLLQLNKKHNFLQSSQVCIDLCAAPGGWLQVASEHMPMSSIIVGVDLVPIRPIPRCITFQDDITKESCYTQLRQELQQWKADCVLHDGSPNVGKSWLQDAYSQSILTLQALKLACDFLKKGGWFITKVFRSKDYQSLMWVFGQLFRKVHATKPQASRNESAEIFVVCENYKSPDKIDKKFFDLRFVFEDVEAEEKKAKIADFKPGKKKKASGYDINKGLLFKCRTVTEFLLSENPIQMLSEVHQLEFDDEGVKEDPLVTPDMINAVKDIKSCGRIDIKNLLKWHEKTQKRKLQLAEKDQPKKEVEDVDSDLELEKQLEEVKEEETKLLKKKKRDVLKERKKLRERMSHSAQSAFSTVDMELFNLDQIKSVQDLQTVTDADVDQIPETLETENDAELDHLYDNNDVGEDESDDMGEDDDYADTFKDPETSAHEDLDEEDENVEDENPLINAPKEKLDARVWFDKEIFKKIDEDVNDLGEVEQAETYYRNKAEKEKKSSEGKTIEEKLKAYHSDSDYDSDSDEDKDYDSEEDTENTSTGGGGGAMEKRALTAEQLALATAIVTSKKKKRDVIDESYNRYTFNEDFLPDWFVEDERETQPYDYLRPHTAKEDVKYYRSRDMKIDARTIKKVAEAKARKKKRLHKKREKVRKQAESITESNSMSNAEKAHQIKSIYKKSGLLKKEKEQKTLVFARRGTGKKVKRPRGVTGKFEVVDRRMKKDKRSKLKGDKKKLKSLRRGRK